MYKEIYRDILVDQILKSVDVFRQKNKIFQQDFDPKHAAIVNKNFVIVVFPLLTGRLNLQNCTPPKTFGSYIDDSTQSLQSETLPVGLFIIIISRLILCKIADVAISGNAAVEYCVPGWKYFIVICICSIVFVLSRRVCSNMLLITEQGFYNIFQFFATIITQHSKFLDSWHSEQTWNKPNNNIWLIILYCTNDLGIMIHPNTINQISTQIEADE